MNRPVRKMGLERTVPGGTGFGANRPVTSEEYAGGMYESCTNKRKFVAVLDSS